MRRFLTSILSVLLVSGPAAASVPPAALALQDAIASVASKSKPAVVNIAVVQEQEVAEAPDFFFGDPEDMLRQFMQGQHGQPRKFRAEGIGSGFIIDPRGFVLTNEHVVNSAKEIRVTMRLANGKDKTYTARVVGRDPNYDMAVVRLESKGETFPYLKLSSAHARVGDLAVAIGSPFALEQTVTLGIVSAERQTLQIEGRLYTKMIQTDASINRGNSGGPLLNIEGDVIGINTAIFSPSGGTVGIGFAIPADEAQTDLKYLLVGKRMSRGWIGIEMAPVDEIVKRRFALPSADGALVNRVLPRSPAARAGLERGDVIRSFNGQTVNTPDDLLSDTADLPAGKKITLGLYRHGAPKDITLTLGERPVSTGEGRPGEEQAPEGEGEGQGESFQWQGVRFSQEDQGVTVDDLKRDSPMAGYLQPGDLIHGINAHPVKDLKDLQTAVKDVKLSEGAFFDIVRDGQPMYLSVKP